MFERKKIYFYIYVYTWKATTKSWLRNNKYSKRILGITRQTASKYLNELANHSHNMIEKYQIGKFNFFINVKLFDLFSQKRNVELKNLWKF